MTAIWILWHYIPTLCISRTRVLILSSYQSAFLNTHCTKWSWLQFWITTWASYDVMYSCCSVSLPLSSVYLLSFRLYICLHWLPTGSSFYLPRVWAASWFGYVNTISKLTRGRNQQLADKRNSFGGFEIAAGWQVNIMQLIAEVRSQYFSCADSRPADCGLCLWHRGELAVRWGRAWLAVCPTHPSVHIVH